MRRLALLACVAMASCVGTTGGDVIDFPAAAAGPADAAAMKDGGFVTDLGWHVVLTKAVLHVGAVYLSQSQPVSGSQVTSCVLPGSYVAQVTTGLDVDLLSGAPQRFPSLGHGTTVGALVGQVWLAGSSDRDLDDPGDTTPILLVEGTADRAGDVRPFSGTITIAQNRVVEGGALAGSNTLCKQRVVSPIATNVTIRHGGGLVLRVDPRLLFVNVDFAKLGKGASGYAFSDRPDQADYSQPSVNLYQNLHSTGVVTPLYSFAWDASL